MDAIGVIPARFGSTRLLGKVLLDLCGKPIIQHVWERAKEARLLDDLIVASDDEQVVKVVQKFGGKAVYTSPGQPSGTDRVAEVVNPIDAKVVVNIQGDEPMVDPTVIDELARTLLGEPALDMATVAKKIEDETELSNPNVVKVVLDKNNFALYFSRAPIPYVRGEKPNFYKHLGLYAYTKDFLFTFANLPHSTLEEAEKLEQLRVLENGYKIKVIETRFNTIGIDTQEDLDRVRAIFAARKRGL